MSTVYPCKTVAGDVTVHVTAASAFAHAGMSTNLLSTDLHFEGVLCKEDEVFWDKYAQPEPPLILSLSSASVAIR